MSRKKTAGILIREIDIKLFEYLYSYKVATADRIARDIFREISHQALYKRLNKFINLGFLEGRYVKELRGKLVYNITTKTFKEYISSGEKVRVQLKSENIFHDLGLVDISQRLKTITGMTSFIPENLLRSNIEVANFAEFDLIRKLYPDALLRTRINGDNFTFAIEYERSMKFHRRYIPIFKKYYASSEIDAVLLIYSKRTIKEKIMEKERAFLENKNPKFFYISIDTFTNDSGKLIFTNINGGKLIL